uniref:Uncharacterized protein n=1 Tax=Panagrolaimus sp. JU765 TaxID=591449 RepID=A0AC34QWM2_9BILA
MAPVAAPTYYMVAAPPQHYRLPPPMRCPDCNKSVVEVVPETEGYIAPQPQPYYQPRVPSYIVPAPIPVPRQMYVVPQRPTYLQAPPEYAEYPGVREVAPPPGSVEPQMVLETVPYSKKKKTTT